MSVTSTVAPPKKKKRASKKTKKSWRKNTDIEEVEDFLEDRRLEERLGGGSFGEKKNEELFVVETTAPPDQEADEEGESSESAHRRLRRRRAAKPLKCFQALEITGGAADPKAGRRNSRRTTDQRQNPIVAKMQQRLREQGVVKAKRCEALRKRSLAAQRKQESALDRSTRRRTNFDFDLWAQEDGTTGGVASAAASKVSSDDWLEPNTKLHTLKHTGLMAPRAPDSVVGDKTSKLPPVEMPHAGASYNPSVADHQDLLWRAAIVEMNKDRAERRVELHTTAMFPAADNAPDEQTWIKEMGEGIESVLEPHGEAHDDDDHAQPAGQGQNEEGEEDGDDGGDDDDGVSKTERLKTKKQRRKARLAKEKEFRNNMKKGEAVKAQDIYRLRSFRRELVHEEGLVAANVAKRARQAEEKRFQPAKLSGHAFEPTDIEIKLSDELTGNLRSLKPEGSLLEDRFKSLQKRNIIETRIPQKVEKRKKTKKYEKRTYKMGWEDEYNARKNASVQRGRALAKKRK